jgi:hypothetical protein
VGGRTSPATTGLLQQINLRTYQIAELERREKKSRIGYHARRDAALPALNRLECEFNGDHSQLCGKDL